MTVKFEKPEAMYAMFKTIKNLILKEKSKYDKDIIESLGTAAQTKSKSNINGNINSNSKKHNVSEHNNS
jgi:hypothetical protein